ncbi:hypothetical protein Cmtc_08990 [Cupriavidus sp. TKC]|uniref:DUF4376 domain-containing protein n=1 Tax=Cupriavidus sp. TKC TaxID=2880159 RepID=UPI0025A824DE|nr:hypothetical protein [Cupriavidus sp. TKC]GMG89679.1 hypothetical protein Cmtc_08990 [Cupriavidus sp. TKC]
MEKIYVQFADATEKTIASVFGAPQDPEVYANLGEIDDADPRYLAFAKPEATLPGAQAAQVAKISAACAAALVAGFASSALGAARTYPSQDTDQGNLFSAVLAAQEQPSTWVTSLWCASDGSWSLAPHDAEQVKQVNADWLAFRQSAQQKYADLLEQINAAKTIAAVLAVSWTKPQ